MATLARLGRFISARDHNMMLRISRWSPPHWVRVWMTSSSRAGDGWLWGSFAIPILWLGGQRRYEAMAVLASAALTGILVFLLLKRMCSRPRPCEIAPIGWKELVPPDRFSFPSGHSITAFAMVVPLSLFYPAFMVEFMFCAVSVASSRVVLGLHFLSDVVAGSLMGAGIGYAAYTLVV
jgi:undecaprenyl-diphosphatase